MNTHTPPPASPCPERAAAGAGGENAARLARNMQMLDRMIAVGMALVEAINREVVDGPPIVPVGQNRGSAPAAPPVDSARFHCDLALGFSRASRGVRLCMALQTRLLEPAPADARAAPAPNPAPDPPPPGADPRARLAHAVERRARAVHDDEAMVARLLNDAAERLSDREQFGHLLNRPFAAVIEQICRDLGLPPPDELPAQSPDPALEPPPPDPDARSTSANPFPSPSGLVPTRRAAQPAPRVPLPDNRRSSA